MGAFQASLTACGKGHPFDEENTYKHNGVRHCRTCRRENMRAAQRAGKRRRTPEEGHRRNIKRFGLTPQQYAEMLLSQGGVCAICHRSEPASRRLAVDHNHETGQVRGLLCTSCNVWLGILENAEWRQVAEAYLNGIT